MQRTGQTLPCQAARRPSRVPEHPSLNRRCNTRVHVRMLMINSFLSTLARHDDIAGAEVSPADEGVGVQ